MRIVVDENIPFSEAFFAGYADITRLPGRTLQNQHLQQADALLVRSITAVNEALLAGTPVAFVGSATIGTDHCDLNYLQQAGIGFSNAPGCNAQGVAEYVVAALLAIQQQRGCDKLQDKTVGIIGAGNVGTAVAACLDVLGIQYCLNDPFKAQQDATGDYVTLSKALSCDIVTFHVPLTREGDYPTYHLLNAESMQQLKSDVIVINSSRGAVIDNKALCDFLKAHAAADAVLDVWEGEPAIDFEVLDYVSLATPHIAGYSFDGKVRGTHMIYQAFCRHFGLAETVTMSGLPAPDVKYVRLNEDCSDLSLLQAAVRQSYDIYQDDNLLRQIKRQADPKRYFDQLRKQYRVRREFSAIRLDMNGLSSIQHKQLQGLGFRI